MMDKKTMFDFVERESKYNLFSVKYKGVSLWELIRFDAYNRMQNNLFYETPIKHNKSIIDSLFSKLKILLFLIVSNPLLFLSKKNVLLIRASRKNKDGHNNWIDPYTINIENSGIYDKLGIYESSIDFFKNIGKPDITVIDILAEKFSTLLIKVLKIKNTKLDVEIEKINQVFPELQLGNQIKYKYYYFIFCQKIYDFILNRRSPKTIYITNYIYKMPLIFVAKYKGIEVIEIQHGFTSQSILLYHFPNVTKNSLTMFPDKFEYLDSYQIFKVELPLSSDNITKWSGDYFNNKKNKYINCEIIENSILFVSQHILYKDFLDFVESFCKENELHSNRFCVYYKPHPLEYSLLDINHMNDLEQIYNFHLIKSDEDIYKYLFSIKNTVGVYSTTLLESFTNNNNIYILKIKGYEYFENLLDEGLFSSVENAKDLYHKIEKNNDFINLDI